MPASVFVASRSDLPDIQKVMDRAFSTDPTVTWATQTQDVFEGEHHRYVAMCAEPAFDHGGVHATPGFEAAAIWYPPGVSVTDADFEVFRDSAGFPDKLSDLGDLAEVCDQYRPAGPHWTLELIAVAPDAQGKGLGDTLMRVGLAQAEKDGLPVFLASSNPRNLTFYERLGFDILGKAQIADTPPMFPMVRHPSR